MFVVDVNSFGVETLPSVVLFKQFDEGKNILAGNLDDISGFIAKNSVPLIVRVFCPIA